MPRPVSAVGESTTELAYLGVIVARKEMLVARRDMLARSDVRLALALVVGWTSVAGADGVRVHAEVDPLPFARGG